MAEAVYGSCALLSVVCAVLLTRGYLRSRARFLLWSALCFLGLAINNLLLFADKVIFPDMDLSVWRTSAAAVSLLLLVLGLVWDTD
jgi:hypothetical protein